jgi:DNA-binding MarR family transcriptional regulator
VEDQGDTGRRRSETLAALGRELRWASAYAVLFSHLQARRAGIHSTDLEAHDILTLSGPMPAGQLAALTGLTTGAVTTLVDRLERAGLARRTPDPGDRRRVIVEALAPPEAMAQQIMPEFQRMGEDMDDLFSSYSDADLALILTFLQRSRAIAAARVAALGGPAALGPDGS